MLKSQQVLDSFVDIYIRSIELDNTRSSVEEKRRANEILIQREKELGVTSEQFDNLLGYIDDYINDEFKYNALLDFYLRQ